MLEYQIRTDFNAPPTIVLYLVVLTLGAFITHNYRDNLKRILLANFSNRELIDHSRDESNRTKKANFWMLIFSLLVFSLLINYFTKNFDFFIGFASSTRLLVATGAVFTFSLLKMGIQKFLGFLFQLEDLNNSYLEQIQLKNKSFAIFVLPFLLLAEFNIDYSDWALKIILAISVLFLLVKWFVGLKIGLIESKFPFVYSILYICTLEILPIVLAAKVLWKPIYSLLA